MAFELLSLYLVPGFSIGFDSGFGPGFHAGCDSNMLRRCFKLSFELFACVCASTKTHSLAMHACLHVCVELFTYVWLSFNGCSTFELSNW